MPEAELGAGTARIQCPGQWLRAIGKQGQAQARGGCPCPSSPDICGHGEELPAAALPDG